MHIEIPKPHVTDETRRQLKEYRTAYGPFLDEMRRDVEELISTGAMTRAKELAAATGQHLNHNRYPMFFTGDLDAKLVLVHLNPKQGDDGAPRMAGPMALTSFEEYFDVHRNWGARFYGVESKRGFVSRFDRKQIVFLRPFGSIPFEAGDARETLFRNLELVVDAKLQMELVPYGSDRFNTGAFRGALVKEHFDRVLRVVTARRRTHVLFCGAVFEPLVREFVVKTHRFQLRRKRDGAVESMTSEFSNLEIPFGTGEKVKAGWCRSWARQGIPMASYAEEVVNRYADR